MRPTRMGLVVLSLTLLLPSAAALSVREDRVDLAWHAERAPNLLAAGRLAFEGGLQHGLVAANLSNARIDAAAIQGNGSSGQTLRVEGGTLLWSLENATNGHAAFTSDYAIGLALANGPQNMGPAAFLVGHALHGVASADGDSALVIKGATRIELGGVVTSGDTAFLARGHMTLNTDADALGGGAAQAKLTVLPADHDGFAEAVDAASHLGAALGADEGNGDSGQGPRGSPFGPDSPLKNIETLSPIFNGAVLVVGSNSADTPALVSRLGDGDFDPGPFSVLRSKDLSIDWTQDGRMTLQGTPSLVISKQGAALPPTATAYGVPLVSFALWIGALAAIIYFFVRRPEKKAAPWSWRLLGWGAWALAYLGAFWVWDSSFATTFGTSFFTMVRAQGVSFATLQNASFVLGLELIPWTLVSLLFALPIRIILGVAFRYLGKDKALKGFAKAGGVLSLALFAPIYGLVLVNGAVALGLKMAGVA